MITNCSIRKAGVGIPYLSEDPALYDLLHAMQTECDEAFHHSVAGNHGHAAGAFARARNILDEIVKHRSAAWSHREH